MVLTPESYSWVSKHVKYVGSLTIQAPLAIPPHCVPRYCQQVQVGTSHGFSGTHMMVLVATLELMRCTHVCAAEHNDVGWDTVKRQSGPNLWLLSFTASQQVDAPQILGTVYETCVMCRTS